MKKETKRERERGRERRNLYQTSKYVKDTNKVMKIVEVSFELIFWVSITILTISSSSYYIV
jgi:hypothetical protein